MCSMIVDALGRLPLLRLHRSVSAFDPVPQAPGYCKFRTGADFTVRKGAENAPLVGIGGKLA